MNMNGYTVVHLVSKMGNIDGLKYMLRWNEKEKDEEYKFNFEVKTKNEKNTGIEWIIDMNIVLH